MAIVRLAAVEAVNATTEDHQPYIGSITARPGASAETAAIKPAYGSNRIRIESGGPGFSRLRGVNGTRRISPYQK